MRRPVLLAFTLAVFLVTALPAAAITYGERDGNTHKNVGALISKDPETGEFFHLCSGTVIAPKVFLTAAHCTAFLESVGIPNDQIWVSFAVDVDPIDESTLVQGEWVTNPEFTHQQNDPKDIAVVLFDRKLSPTPAKLPKKGVLDQLKAEGKLRGAKFTAVGYGVHEPEVGPGGPTFPYDGERWRAVSEFNALNNAWLRLSQNDATGDGGTCFGDSGGPNFFGTGSETVPGTIASITVTGDAMCLATNDTLRLDTESARRFLGNYVKLP